MFKKIVNSILSFGLSSSILATPVQANGLPFVDILPDSWYEKGVQYVYDKKIMTGLNLTHFGPSDTMNRAMLVTVLYRIENEPLTPNLLTFQDVPYGSYFIDAVRWANAKGIVTGYDANRFGPSDPVTREQIATILKRYHDYKGRQSGPSDDLSAYWDKYRVSQFADNAMRWAVGNGIISGLDSTTLGPQGDANRAQVATILMRYLEKQDLTENPDYQAPDENDSQDDTPSIPDNSNEPSYLYEPADISEIKTDPTTKVQYVDSILLILFTKSAMQSQIDEAIESVNGTIVGELGVLDLYQVKVPVSGMDQLNTLADSLLNNFDFIKTVTYDEIVQDSLQALTPDDPFNNDVSKEDWMDSTVGGSNWWLEAAKVPSLWGLEDNLKPTEVGVIDSCIHSNSDINYSFINSENETRNTSMAQNTNSSSMNYWHGTAVSGIIGAIHNDKAIAGVNPKAEIVFATPFINSKLAKKQGWSSFQTSRALQAFEIMIKRGIHVINFSLGRNTKLGEYVLSSEIKEHDSKLFSGVIDNLMTEGYDNFIVVNSAGNGDSKDHNAISTYSSGFFCSIVPDSLCEDCAHSYDQIMDHVLIGGSVGKEYTNGKWPISDFSNRSGSDYLIFAPGEEIYTTVPTQISSTGATDKGITGTSFAAPIISGVISAIWSLNPSWDASTVQNIILASAEDKASDGSGIYKMINAENATIMAASLLNIDQGLAITPNPLYLKQGQSAELSLSSNLGFTVDNKFAVWSVEDGSSVIDQFNGKVTAKQPGEAVVEATYRGISTRCKIVVSGSTSNPGEPDNTPEGSEDSILNNELYKRNVHTIAAGTYHAVAIRKDKTVTAVGLNADHECDVSGWTNVVSVAAADYYNGHSFTIGLKENGTVVYAGGNYFGEKEEISKWKDIVAITTGYSHAVGLKRDGTVVIAGANYTGRGDVSAWTDIVSIAAGQTCTIGLKSDGSVVADGFGDYYGQCNVSDWRNITAITAGFAHTVGLQKDGKVVAVGNNNEGACDVSTWNNIVAISASQNHTFGLKKDGSVIVTAKAGFSNPDTSNSKDVIDISAADSYCLALKKDGTVQKFGNIYANPNSGTDNYNVASWTDILVP